MNLAVGKTVGRRSGWTWMQWKKGDGRLQRRNSEVGVESEARRRALSFLRNGGADLLTFLEMST